MNNIESLKDVLKEIRKQTQLSADNLNSALESVGMHTVNFSDPINTIEQQINSADNKFTIGFVGTFSTGKSTIINSLLELKGDARLSSDYDPDTARCVKIMKKGDRTYEAEIDFDGVYPTVQTTWNEAKKYTSHVHLENESVIIQEKAKHIKEVRYYLDSPLLELCNILDLPGTASGGETGAEDAEIAEERINETDCFFWVIPTSAEPDPNDLQNLQKIQHKLLPIINVWEYEKDEIKGVFTPDEIIKILNDGYADYLVNAEDPVIYYAKEIDEAQQQGYALKPEWGKEVFVNKVQEILNNIQTGDRAKRILNNVLKAFNECKVELEGVRTDRKFAELKSEVRNDKSYITTQLQRLERCNNIVEGDLNDAAKKQAQEIVGIVSDASQTFIQNKMSGIDLKNMLRMFGKKYRDEMSEEFTKEFKDKYLRFDNGWLDSCVKEFSRDIISILKSKYIDFSQTINNGEELEINSNFDAGEMSEFVDTIAEQIQINAQGKLISVISATLTTTLILLIPGYSLFDAIASVFSVGKALGDLGSDSKLRAKINMVVDQAKVQIRQQRYTIQSQLNEQATMISKQFYTKVKNQLDKDKSANALASEKLALLMSVTDAFERMIASAEQEIKIAIGG